MNTNRRLLLDCHPFRVDPASLKESKIAKEGNLFVRGTIQRADSPNGNGRIYPRNLLEREVGKYQSIIKEGRALGELDHPSDKDTERDDPLTVLLKNASHAIHKIEMVGNEVKAEIQVLDFLPMGKILRGLLEHGITVGISSRGFGSVVHDGKHSIVQPDIEISCWDMVWLPSTQGAFMEGYMKEASVFAAYQKPVEVNPALYASVVGHQKPAVALPSPTPHQSAQGGLEEALEALRAVRAYRRGQ